MKKTIEPSAEVQTLAAELIKLGLYEQDEESFLLSRTVERLEQFKTAAAAIPGSTPVVTPLTVPVVTPLTVPVVTPPQGLTFDNLLDAAPVDVKTFMSNLAKKASEERKSLVEKLSTCGQTHLSKEQLGIMSLQDLQSHVAMLPNQATFTSRQVFDREFDNEDDKSTNAAPDPYQSRLQKRSKEMQGVTN